METNEQMKKEAKELAVDLIRPIKIANVVIAAECPEAGDLMIDTLVEELEKLRKPKAQTEGCTCHSEGPVVAKCNCGDGMTEPEKSVLHMDFGSAIQALKQGKCVARKGWNGKHQYVELATCISYKGNAGEIVNCVHNDIGNKALAFVGTSGVQLGWLASQADMLAEDWYIVE